MKSKSALHVFLVVSGSALLLASQAHSATYYWDTDGSTAGLGDTAGTWGTNTFLATVPGGILGGTVLTSAPTTTNADTIYFGTNNLTLGGTASTISIAADGVTINSIVFGAGQTNPVTLIGGGGTITLAGTTPTITVNNTSDTIAAVIGVGSTVTKAGAGTLILSGANTFMGGVNINSGTLQIGNGVSGSLAQQNLTFNGTGVFNVVGAAAGGTTQAMEYLNFNAGDGTVQSTYGGDGTSVTTLSFTDISAITLGATTNFVTSGGVNGTNNLITFSGQLSSNSNAYLYKSIFFNGSSYAAYDSGGFMRAVGAGDAYFLSFGAGAAMGACSSTDTVLLTGSLSAQGNASVSSINLGANNITMSGSVAVLETDGLLSSGSSNATIVGGKLQTTTSGIDMVIRVNGSSDQLTISSSIQDNAGSCLTKSGAGTLVLAGVNTYTGNTTINSGILAVSGGDGIENTSSVVLADAAGAVFRLDSNETIGNLYGGGFSGGNVNVQGNTLTIANATSFGGTFSGTSGGGVTISSGTLTLTNKNSFAGTITLLGTSQLTLTYANDGTTNPAPLSSGGTISMADGTFLNLNPTANAAGGVASVSMSNQSSGWSITNAINVSSGTATIQTTGATGLNDIKWNFSGGVTGGTSGGVQTLAINHAGFGTASQGDRQDLLFSGVIANGSGGTPGTLGLSVDFRSASSTSQSGYVNLSAQNTFTGPIVVANFKGLLPAFTVGSNVTGGFLVIGGERFLNGAPNNNVIVGSGYIGGGNYTNTISLATGTFLDYASSANQTLGGVISGGGAVVIEGAGAGTLTLSNSNNYSGGTIVSSGMILLSGANNLPSTGALDVRANGTFSLADGTARTTTAAGLTLASGANFVFDWNGGSVDSLTTSATVAPGAAIVGIGINKTGATPSGGPLTLITGGASSTLNTASYYLANATDYTATITKTATTVSIGSYASATALTNIYWTGNKLAATAGANNAWALSDGTKSNWSSTTTAYTATALTPGSTANVIFANGQVGKAQQSTVLGANVTVNSVTIDDATAVTIAGSGNTLTLLSTSSTAGTVASPGSAISVTANAANPTISTNVVLGGSGTSTWNVANGKTLTVSGTVSGGNALTKADAGTLVLSGNGIYSGITTVSAGTLQFTNQTSLYSNNTANWTAANIKVNSGATLSFNVGGTNQFTAASITTLLNNLGGLGGAITNNGLQSGSFIGFDTTGASPTIFTVADNIADSTGSGGGAIGVTKLGSNTLLLTGSNTYTGATTIAAGTLRISNSAALGSASNTLVFRGGILQAGGAFTSVSTRGVVMTGAGTIDTNGNAVSIAGSTSGAGLLTKSGLGTLTLSNTIGHTGGITVSAGTLLLSGPNNLSATGTLTVSNGATFSLADGTARTTTGASTGVGLTLATGSNLAFDWNGSSIDSLTLSGTATASSAGSVGIIINNLSPTGAGGTLISTVAASTLNVANYFTANNTNYAATITKAANSVSISSYANVTELTNAYWKRNQVTGATDTMAYSLGGLSNWASDAAGTSAGGVVPGGSNVNVIFGSTSVSTFAVALGANMNLGSITFNDTAAVTITGSAGSNIITLNSTSGTAASTTGALQTVTAGSAISVTSFANATNTINDNIVLGANQTWNVASGKNLVVSGVVSGTSSLTKAGAGTLTLSGANTFSGGLTIKAGTVSINTLASTNALGTDTVTIGDAAKTGAAATLQFHGGGSFPTFINDINVTGNGTNIIGATSWNPIINGSLNLANNLTLASNNATGSTMTFNGGVSGTGNITVSIGNSSNASFVTFGSTAVNHVGTLTYNNASVAIGSTAGVAGTGNGTNTITGGVGSNVTAITQGSNSNPLTISSNALTVNSSNTTLTASGTALFTVSGGIVGAGNLILNSNNNTSGILLSTVSSSTVNNSGTITNSGTGTASTTISALIGFNVTGVIQNSYTSALILSNSNIYTGATTINSGVLTLQGNGNGLGATEVTVNSSGVLAVKQGASSTSTVIGGSVILNSGSGLNMADGFTSTLNVTGGDSILADASGVSSVLTFDIIGAVADKMIITGAATAGAAGAKINIAPSTTAITTGNYTLITGGLSSALNSNFSLVSSLLTNSGGLYTLSLGSSDATNTKVTVAVDANALYWKGGTSTDWNTASNWTTDQAGTVSSGAAPVSTKDLAFNASGAGNLTTNTLTAGLTVNSVNFLPGASSVTVASSVNQLTINGGGITNASANAMTINNPITLGAAQTWTNSGAGLLTIGGAVTNGSNDLAVAGTGNTTISGAIGGGAGGLTMNGTGVLILSGDNSYTGATTITTGTLQLNGSTNASSTVNIGTTGTLTGSGTVNGHATLTGSGVINKSSGTIAGTLGVTGGKWNGAGAVTGLVTSSSGTFTIGSGANLTANGDLNITGGTIAAGSSSSTITGSVNYTSDSSSTFAGVVAGSGKTLTMNNAAATLTLSGANTYTGTTTVSSGSLVINGAVASTSLVVNGSLSGSGTMANATISGSGSINPGNSPGILTGSATNPTGGLDYNFEFTAAGTLPAWNTPTSSLNDVLRLTDAANPITASMTSLNLVSIFLNVGSIASGNVFTGGFYTDKTASFLSSISGASFQYYIADPVGAVEYNGNKYDLYSGPLNINVNTVAQTADFGSGNVSGYTTQFTVSSDPYLQWAGAGVPFGNDNNGDGIPNGLAWLLGAANPTVNARPYLPVPVVSSGNIHLHFNTLNTTSRGTASIKVQYSNDLGASDSWTSHEAEVPDTSGTVGNIVFTITPSGNYLIVDALIPVSAASASKKLFTRVSATQP